jgi:tRNA (guanine10-N2)-methyltransferase
MSKYELKARQYIGNTSFESELSLVTANQALVWIPYTFFIRLTGYQAQPGMLIYDPFVGTGSFLYTCSHFGAVTFGKYLFFMG